MPNDVVERTVNPQSAQVANAAHATRRVRELPVFDLRAFLSSVGEGRTATIYAAKRNIFRQGDAAASVFFIEKGQVRLTIASEQGKERVIAILGPGEFFGEGCLAGQPLRLSTASAMEESQVVKVEVGIMVRLLAEQPDLAQFFIGHLLSRISQCEADLVDQLFNSSEKRLARVLLLLAHFGKEENLQTIPNISQGVLAARVGTTRGRINFFMNKFRSLGLIEYHGGGSQGAIKIHSALLNMIVHD